MIRLSATAIVGILGFALGVTLAVAGDPPPQKPVPATKPSRFTLSGPFTHDNLTVFLIHGEDRIKGKVFLTLQEALAQKKAVMHETKQVNQLAVDNLSADEEVFVQAGDIVKGGQQDRIIAYDLILPAKSGKMPVACFCVEAGRWTQRGQEDARQFQTSNAQAPTKELKLAVREDMAQNKVWEKVAEGQTILGSKLGASVAARESRTSLQLSLENKKLQETVEPYVKKLVGITEQPKDVIGYAVAVNGQIHSADVYVSHALFQKLWPVLLKGSAVEAVAGMQKGKKFVPPAATAVRDFLAEAEKGKVSEKQVSQRVRLIRQESGKVLLFRCVDDGLKGAPAAAVRESYLAH